MFEYTQSKNFDKANPLVGELQTKAASPAEKVWVEILKGDIEFQKEIKQELAIFTSRLLVIDPTSKDGYEHMGDLYFISRRGVL